MGKKATSDGGERRKVAGAVNPAVTEKNPVLAESVSCPTCGQLNPPLGAQTKSTGWGQPVYAVGRLSPQFPTIGVEKGFAQLTEGAYQGDQVEVEELQRVLSRPENAYLGRYLCWGFASEGLDTFTVLPREDADVARLAEVLSPAEAAEVVHVIVGRTVPSPIDWRCAASGLPAVQADRVLAFTLQEFAAAIPENEASDGEQPGDAPSNTGRTEFEAVVRGVFLRLTRRAGNRGLTPEHMACNYVACEYAAFYHAVRQAQRDGKVLVGIDTQHSHSADRRVVAVRATFRHPRTDITERLQCLVDVTEPSFFFLITGLQPVYE